MLVFINNSVTSMAWSGLIVASILYLNSVSVENDIKPVRPKEIKQEEKYQHKLPKEKRKHLRCEPTWDIYHQPSCIKV